MSRFVLPSIISIVALAGHARAHAAECSAAKYDQVLAPATASASHVYVDCDLHLEPTDRITKRIIIQGEAASGTTIQCNGATIDGGPGTVNQGNTMIEIRSVAPEGDQLANPWSRPENVTIRGCVVRGRIHTKGMAATANGALMHESSRKAGHVGRVRNNAPRDVTIEDSELVGVGRIPLYIGPGTTGLRLVDSEINGTSNSVAIYFGAESTRSEIRANYIHPATTRELLAVDASDFNKIVNNRFSSLSKGGIYLYRNCGEDGVSRHTTPSFNHIINNVFYYNKYTGSNPSVYIGSRNGNRGYCDEDDDSPYGSGYSDLDYARSNGVFQNQIYKRSLSDMIKIGGSVNTGNHIAFNETVTAETYRLAGCYTAAAYDTDYLFHGDDTDVFNGSYGAPECNGWRLSCTDGDLAWSASTATCDIDRVVFDCRASGDNRGCSKTAWCPSGKRILGSVAGCNLEWGTVSDSALATIVVNTIRVLRASDNVSDGSCWIGSNTARSGSRDVSWVNGNMGVSVGCKEHDGNGGDCHIRGALYCR